MSANCERGRLIDEDILSFLLQARFSRNIVKKYPLQHYSLSPKYLKINSLRQIQFNSEKFSKKIIVFLKVSSMADESGFDRE